MLFQATTFAVIAVENHFIISLDSVSWLGSSGQLCSMWCSRNFDPLKTWLGWVVQDGQLMWRVLAVGVCDLLGVSLRLLPRVPDCGLSMWLGSERQLLRLSISRNLIRSCWGSYDSDGPGMGKMSFQWNSTRSAKSHCENVLHKGVITKRPATLGSVLGD